MDLPQRKYPRLKHYDYSTPGAYFITICTQGKRCLLSRIVGRGLAPAETVLTRSGQIAKRELELLPSRYQGTVIEHFVIMPNHIHFIVRISDIAAGASPRPTVMDMVCTYKSLTARACKEEQNIYGKIRKDGRMMNSMKSKTLLYNSRVLLILFHSGTFDSVCRFLRRIGPPAPVSTGDRCPNWERKCRIPVRY